MEDRITKLENDPGRRDDRDGPRRIGEILAELLSRYQIRFPEARTTVVRTPAG